MGRECSKHQMRNAYNTLVANPEGKRPTWEIQA